MLGLADGWSLLSLLSDVTATPGRVDGVGVTHLSLKAKK